MLGTAASLPARAVNPLWKWLQKTIGVKRLPWAFLAPNMASVLFFSLLPVFINIYYSVTGSDNLFLDERPFVGGSNYATLLACENYLDPATCSRDLFWRALGNLVMFVPLQVMFMMGVALITAIALNGKIRARGFFRGVFFFPVMLSPVVVALTWQWILQRNGILNGILGVFGLERFTWLADPHWAFFWTIFVTVWAHSGFFMIILLAGLQSIPQDVYEAAKMDRASPWRVFTRITVPMLRPVLLVVFILAVIRSVQTFDEIYVLTGGGPGSATMLLVQYIYETGFAAQPRNYGLAAAASLLLGAALLVFTLVQMKLSGDRK
ncbi:sugar ABC transporter permease [Martelella sp. AD-3]|uniref:carbohydrate ABC transporter permease n=1 Tax=Martelella sp. AD-3 TaxID=686597 RepID=UPI000463B6CE|nr:sugar ABC transporter permease [Martelella sp. AD-3]AMM86236.1 sugar ABC transporter permease [Martelella sp. AD-3]MAM13507.1 sugar ABC transporter permease [Rhizobiaceae bacterium]